jgi:EAL domain-containing protein (putative c-di-GMP-specific phosphodiesterase class I)
MNFGFTTNLTDNVRMITVWAHALLTAGLLCGGVVLLQTNFSSATRLISELRSAIAQKQFELFFQPQVDGFGKLIGAEALIRWKHPTRGYIAPDKFIPVAERAGLMPDIGKWVLETAVQTLALWNATDRTKDLVLSINVSPDQFLKGDFATNVKSLLQQSGVVPTSLKLELTETMFVSEVDSLITKIQELKDSGIAIALDDFGTGYSSLSYLRHLPLQQLKIDRSFVQAINTDRGALMARSISQMGHDLGLEILAEGIETEEQFTFMLDCGCKAFQGYYFGRPVTLAAFQDYLNIV